MLIDGNAEVAGLVDVDGAGSTIQPNVWHEVGSAGEPAFTNSWVNYAGGYDTAGFMIDPFGFVHLKGLVTNGTDNTSAFTLPAGYRPPLIALCPAAAADYATRMGLVIAHPTGEVVCYTANTWVSLENVTFRVS